MRLDPAPPIMLVYGAATTRVKTGVSRALTSQAGHDTIENAPRNHINSNYL